MKLIDLANGWVTKVDDEDVELVEKHHWRLSTGGYVATTISIDGKRTTLRMHRLILGLPNGDPRQGDHINGDPLDNRRANLRICSSAENGRNVRHRGSSGYKGVYYSATVPSKPWLAQLRIDGRTKTLGRFANPADAHAAFVEAAKTHHGEFFCQRADMTGAKEPQ